MPEVKIRLLGPGDEAVVERLATREPRTALLHDPRTLFLVAFDGETPAGFVLAYALPRRHGLEVTLCVYEVDVAEGYRRRGIGRRLLGELEAVARERGIEEGFVLTEAGNAAAMRLYESAGGVRSDVVEWDFDYTGA
jgi:ribosomal protein S18 acetylase RimI-like enzyme